MLSHTWESVLWRPSDGGGESGGCVTGLVDLSNPSGQSRPWEEHLPNDRHICQMKKSEGDVHKMSGVKDVQV